MKSHTSEFKEEIKLLGKQQDVRITYTINDEQIVLSSEDINSATPNYEASLLKSVMKGLDLDSNVDIPLGTQIKFEYGLLVNGVYEYLNYGNYIVYSSEKQEDTLSYKITCYDKMLYSMKDYEHIEITYPCTIKEYLIALCNKIGLEFKDSTFANQDREIQNELFMTTNEDGTYSSMGYTYRDVLDQIAETTGGCICLTLDDKVEVRYVNKTINYEQSKKSNIIQFKTEVEEPIILERLEGKSIQATRSGKNLFDASKISNSNIIVSDNGKIITMPIVTSGNGYASTSSTLQELCPNLNVGDTVYLFFKKSDENYNQYIHLNGSSFLWYRNTARTITQDDLSGTVALYGNRYQDGQTEQIKIIDFIITKENNNEYEQYGASPSPDYPAKIENVEGKNLFDGHYTLGTINIAGAEVASSTALRSDFIEIQGNTNYIFSSPDNAIYIRQLLYDKNKNFIKTVPYYFKTTEDTKYIRFVINGTNQNTRVQLEEGTVATPYVPYNSLAVKVTGKNKFDKSNTTTQVGYFSSNGTLNSGGGSTVITSYISIKPNTDMTLSGFKLEWICFYDKNKNFIERASCSTNNINTFNKNAYYIRIQAETSVFNLDLLQLEQGSTATDYEEHQKQIVYFPLAEGQKLMEGSYLADDGIHHKRKQIVLDGTESIVNVYVNTSTTRFGFSLSLTPDKKIGLDNVLSTHFKCDTTVYYDSQTQVGICGNARNVNIYIRVNGNVTTDEFKTWLAQQYANGTPVIIEYELATEEIVPYTEAQKTILTSIKTMKGTNIFEFPSDTIISYPINYDTIDEEYINNTNVSFGEKYGAINSIVLARAGESDKIYKKDQASIDENGLCELMISENQFMNFNDRSDYLQELSDKLFGVEYYLNDFTSTGIMYYDLLDVYNVKIGDKTYNCLMLNDEQDITQGLEENIHTERPEKSETDYTKADKTDQKINQTNLIVDKQNQKIEGVISQIGDRSDKTTTITADIDGINSKVENIQDFTKEKTQIENLFLDDIAEGEGYVLNFKVYGDTNLFKSKKIKICASKNVRGYGVDIGLLAEDGQELLTEDGKTIIIGEGSSYLKSLEITLDDYLRNLKEGDKEYYDTLEIAQDGTITITRNIKVASDGTLYALSTPIITTLKDKIVLPSEEKGTYYFIEELAGIKYSAEYIIKNDYSKTFLPRLELGTQITQNAEAVKIAWNQISEFIQMMVINQKASLAILDNSKKILMSLDKTGQHFYDSSENKIGDVGVINYKNTPMIAFNLNVSQNNNKRNGLGNRKKWNILSDFLYCRNIL